MVVKEAFEKSMTIKVWFQWASKINKHTLNEENAKTRQKYSGVP